MEIQFCGAARSVTGSMHLITVGGKKLLLDCGLYQGRRSESRERNVTFPFDPRQVDAMILSHAHIDHSGNIPNLVKQGFKGKIYCTTATQDLCEVMLKDSAFIQVRDAEYLNKKHPEDIPITPIYDERDAEACLQQFRGLFYGKKFDPVPNVQCTLLNAGHMFGSAMLELEITENGKKIRLGFTGDLGRKNLPIIEDPSSLKNLDILISESTYGNKIHDPVKEIQGDMLNILREAVSRGGAILIPAFSVERTQEVLYHLNALYESHQAPEIPVFVDSPLSHKVTGVFEKHPEYYDAETRALLEKGDLPFSFKKLNFISTVEESKQLNDRRGPCIIIAASGMCEAGRIVHHLKSRIGNEKTTLLIVGFMAVNTLGRKLLDGDTTVKIFGEEREVHAQIRRVNAFSGHGDKNDLLSFARGVNQKASVFLVHGETTQSLPFAETLKTEGFAHVHVPDRLDKFVF